MRSARFESDSGLSVEFAREPFILKSLDGNDMSGEAETVKPPRADGRRTLFVSNSPRTINITGSVVAYGDKTLPAERRLDQLRHELCAALNPKYFGLLTYRTEDGDRRIRCRPAALPTLNHQTDYSCTLDVEFISDRPYWESVEERRELIGFVKKLFYFPLVLPTTFGLLHPRGTVTNPTTEIIYPRIEITATARHVTVKNETTGLFLKVQHPILEGQRLIIETFDFSAVIWNCSDGVWSPAENVTHWLSFDSDYWGLEPGENEIIVSNEKPEDSPITYIYYRIPYMGV